MANTIQIKHSPNDVTPSAASVDLAKGELAWVDHGTGGANGKLYIGDATAAGAVQRHIGGVGTGAVAAAAAAGSLTGTTMASNVVTSSLTTVGTIGSGTWEATDVAVSHGGTGASSASSARTNLGVAIGSDVQAYDAQLAALAGVSSTNTTAVGNLTGTNSGDEVAATASVAGVIELATDALTYLISAVETGTRFASAVPKSKLAAVPSPRPTALV